MERLTLEQILFAVQGKCLNTVDTGNISITSVSTDSRNVKKDSLFIPLKGESFDGHLFIESAFEKGASIALTQEELEPKGNDVLVWVKDTKKALADLASYYRSQFALPVIAVTGSVGKTSTKDLIASVLESKYKVHKTQGNFNNEIGLPLTIFGLEKEHEVLVVEMGMNHFGEIHNLTKIARPYIAVITNIGVSHIEHLGSREGILKAKCEILDGMNQEGILIVNGEDDLLKNLTIDNTLITYGKSPTHLYYATEIKATDTAAISARIHTPISNMEITIPALGEHMIDNALAAIAIAQYLNLSTKEIIDGLLAYQPSKMRMDLQTTTNGVGVINDAYNASPESMKAAIEVLTTIPNTKRRIAILGDMFEMGKYAKGLHYEVGQYIGKKANIDLLVTVGELSKFIYEGAEEQGMSKEKILHFQTQEDLILNIKWLIQPQDLVLIKASRGMKLEKTVEEIGKVKFNG